MNDILTKNNLPQNTTDQYPSFQGDRTSILMKEMVLNLINAQNGFDTAKINLSKLENRLIQDANIFDPEKRYSIATDAFQTLSSQYDFELNSFNFSSSLTINSDVIAALNAGLAFETQHDILYLTQANYDQIVQLNVDVENEYGYLSSSSLSFPIGKTTLIQIPEGNSHSSFIIHIDEQGFLTIEMRSPQYEVVVLGVFDTESKSIQFYHSINSAFNDNADIQTFIIQLAHFLNQN